MQRGRLDTLVPRRLAAVALVLGALLLVARRVSAAAPTTLAYADAGEVRVGSYSAPLPGGAAESLQVYRRSALTLRDIHSLKLTRTRRWADRLRFWLIALSTSATCLGFIGVADLADDIGVAEGPVNFMVNVVLLLLLLAVIGELAWRHGDRSNEHQRAIVVLTSFIRDLENRLRQPVDPDDVELAAVQRFGERHELIIEILPAHTDADYLAAKRAKEYKTVEKERAKREAERRLTEISQGKGKGPRWRRIGSS